jgi:hypothetical protein
MSYYDLDPRTRLLMESRAVNGVRVHVDNDRDQKIMNQMVDEGLFRRSEMPYSEGYWWTPEGERAAEEAFESAPVQRFETSYRDHPQVELSLNFNKEELCHVTCKSRSTPLWVRESLGNFIVDHPSGMHNMYFDSADEAIEWALTA